jgi:hypothetical protein
LKRVSNFVQVINDYEVENKYDLKEQIHSMLKYPNQKLLDEEIIITLKLGHRKVKSNYL